MVLERRGKKASGYTPLRQFQVETITDKLALQVPTLAGILRILGIPQKREWKGRRLVVGTEDVNGY